MHADDARLGVVRLASFAGLGLVGLRAVLLTIAPADETLELAAIQRWGTVEVQARRGAIVDRSGHRLAASVDTPHVVADPSRVETPERAAELAAELGRILDVPEPTLRTKLRGEGRYARLALHVHPAAATAVMAMSEPALGIEHAQARHYPDEGLASHVLGFVDAAGIGRIGVEATMESYLQGSRVKLERRRDRRGDGVGDPRPPDAALAGMTVHLTLDRAIQRAAEDALLAAVARDAPHAASAVVIDVPTGDVLAMASWPDYDPNRLDDDAGARRNRAIESEVEPGSVLKVFTLAAALEEQVVSLDTVIDVENGAWRVPGATIHDVHPASYLSAANVVVYSSNIGASKLAHRVGAERFLARLRAFGFGARTGIELPAERTGILRDADAIRPVELATTSFGQGMTATTLQLAMATAALGNDGVLTKPRLVSRIEDAHGLPEWMTRPQTVRRVVSSEVARAVVDTMVRVTAPGGPAPLGRVPGVDVAGKTGTAQKPGPGGYGDQHVSSFIALAPAHEPALAVAVVVDAPSRGRISGASVAAPVASAILARGLRHVGAATGNDVSFDPVAGLSASPHAAEPRPMEVEPIPGTSVRVTPDLRDQLLRDAVVVLRDAELSWTVRGSGRVVEQDPEPGSVLVPGDRITLVLQ